MSTLIERLEAGNEVQVRPLQGTAPLRPPLTSIISASRWFCCHSGLLHSDGGKPKEETGQFNGSAAPLLGLGCGP